MSDDWNNVTKIGSKVSGGPSQRETVVKGKGALNAAQRTGAIVGREKKFAVGNQVRLLFPFPPSCSEALRTADLCYVDRPVLTIYNRSAKESKANNLQM